ncbi:MAG: TonB-dependent receptor [Acidobacteriota bacterium]|nr:TonB-dependent receptor [Acidobacteriota bacterium]
MPHRIRTWILLLSTALAGHMQAQIDVASITGKVTDPTGAAIANAQVSVIAPDTNFQFATVTNGEGIYRIPSLQPGSYQLTFEAAGFKKTVEQGITLRVGDVLPVDVKLEVGSTSESIKVTGESPLLETETSAVGTVTEGDTLYRLPMYQRYVATVLNLVPGVSEGGATYGGSLGGFNVNGGRWTGTAVFEDGVLGVHPQSSTGTVIRPIENSVEEVKVLTGILPAEYGHTSGGVVSVVKKSGANELHGMASDYGRTRRMTHRTFFNQYRTSQAQPGAPDGVPAWFMQPDANVSGPIVVPKLFDGRNKAFFFFGYQKLIEKKSAAMTNATPTPDELNGDFAFGGAGNVLYDPATTVRDANGNWTRAPFPTRQLPLSRIDPVAAKILQINPWNPPNQPGGFTSTGPTSNYTWESRSRTFFEDFNGRTDQQISTKLKLYESYTYNHASGYGRPANIHVAAFDATNGTLTPFTEQNGSVGTTYILSPSLVNDFRIGYYRSRNDTLVPSFGQNYAGLLGIPNVSPALLPAFSANSNQFSPDGIYGLTTTGPSTSIAETRSLRDDVGKVFGAHALKMGYEYLNWRLNYSTTGQPSGTFQFDQVTAGLQPNGQPVPNTGNTFAGFELGAVRAATFSTYTNEWLPRDSMHSLYVQDDWKFSRKLTLNLGLRWSTESPYHTAHGQQSNFSPTTIDPITGKMGAIIHPTGNLSARDWKNFQPRFGAAWHPLDKFVFRGGFAINTVDIRFPNSFYQFDEYQALNVQQRAPGDPRPLFQLSQGPAPAVFNIQPDGSAPYNGSNFSSRNVTWLDGNLHPAYEMNWNATIEYQARTNDLIKLYYSGSAGVHLVESWNRNAFSPTFGAGNSDLQTQVSGAVQNYLPYPQFGSINYLSNTGHSTFHSGTVQYQRRYAAGLVLDAFYTLSKAIDQCDTDGGVCTGVDPVYHRNLSKARAGFDRSHRVIASATYELPVGKGRRFVNRGGFWDYLIGGYELAWIQTYESGNPISFTFANSPNNYYPSSIAALYPNVVGTPTLEHNEWKNSPNRFNSNLIEPVIDINKFAYPSAFTPGNAGRNIVTGPHLMFSELSAKKNFRLSERLTLQFRFDFQNVFHNFNFNAPTTTVDFRNPQTFGKFTSDQTTASNGGQPLMNIALRLSW